MNSDDAIFVAIGLVMSLIGWLMIGSRGYIDVRFGYIDFGAYHHLIGMFILCVGVIIVFAILNKYLQRK